MSKTCSVRIGDNCHRKVRVMARYYEDHFVGSIRGQVERAIDAAWKRFVAKHRELADGDSSNRAGRGDAHSQVEP